VAPSSKSNELVQSMSVSVTTNTSSDIPKEKPEVKKTMRKQLASEIIKKNRRSKAPKSKFEAIKNLNEHQKRRTNSPVLADDNATPKHHRNDKSSISTHEHKTTRRRTQPNPSHQKTSSSKTHKTKRSPSSPKPSPEQVSHRSDDKTRKS
jgi:hypothetical protein